MAKRAFPVTIMTALGALLLFGCGGGDATGSCETRALNGVCEDYVGPADVVATYKAACTQGTWKDGLCDRSGSVGGCQTDDASLQLTLTNWEFAPATTESLKQQCQAPSTFVSP
jgi:hypothetical protein